MNESFGVGWLVLSSHVHGDEACKVHVLPLLGRGFLLKTTRQLVKKGDDGELVAAAPPVFDTPHHIEDVLLIDTYRVEESEIKAPDGSPASTKSTLVNRELMGMGAARRAFQPKSGKKPMVEGLGNQNLVSGMVLTMVQKAG